MRRPGTAGLVRLAVPRVEFDGRDLGHGDKTLDAIDLQIGLSVAFNGRQLDEIGYARHGMALEEFLVVECHRAHE